MAQVRNYGMSEKDIQEQIKFIRTHSPEEVEKRFMDGVFLWDEVKMEILKLKDKGRGFIKRFLVRHTLPAEGELSLFQDEELFEIYTKECNLRKVVLPFLFKTENDKLIKSYLWFHDLPPEIEILLIQSGNLDWFAAYVDRLKFSENDRLEEETIIFLIAKGYHKHLSIFLEKQRLPPIAAFLFILIGDKELVKTYLERYNLRYRVNHENDYLSEILLLLGEDKELIDTYKTKRNFCKSALKLVPENEKENSPQ